MHYQKSFAVSNPQKINRLKKYRNKGYDILTYDKDNFYPQRISSLIGMSGAGSIATERFAKHIIGQGFEDESFNELKVNRYGLTMFGLLRNMARSYSKFRGFALHFNYNIFGQWVELNYIPFEWLRLGLPDDLNMINNVKLYNNWANEEYSKIQKANIKKINVFNPNPDVVLAQMEAAKGVNNYRGQILYYGEDGMLKYPLSEFDPVRDDLETDGNIQVFKGANVRNKFQASHIITTRKFEEPKEKEGFQGSLKQIQGPEAASSVMHFEVEDWDDLKPPIDIQSIQAKSNDKVFEWHERSCQDSIRKAKGIPPVMMAEFPVGGLGNMEEYQNGFKIMNQITKDERKLFSSVLKSAFDSRASIGNATNNFNIAPLNLEDNGVNNQGANGGNNRPANEPE